MQLQLDGASSKPTTHSAPHKQSYSTYGEKMVSAMRSEPALPLVDDTVAGETDVASTKTADDSASLHSTSTTSRSFFRPSSFRRRTTDQSSVTKGKDSESTKRTSAVLDEEDESGLSLSVDLQLQQQKDAGDWGIADDARMNLE